MVGMDDKQIIQEAADEVGRTLGRLQGKLFVVEAKCEALRAKIKRLDAVYQNLRGESPKPQPKAELPDWQEVAKILEDRLPKLDPSSQRVCEVVYNLLVSPTKSTNCNDVFKQAIAVMESHGWKQGEAIALAQKVVQYLRNA